MIRKSGHRFSEKIMLKKSRMTFRRKVILRIIGIIEEGER